MLWKSLQTGWIDWEGSIIRETAVSIYLAFQLFWKIILNVAAHWFAKWPIMTSKAQSLFSKGVKKKKINLYHTWDKNTLFLSLKGQFTLNWKGSSYLQSLATTLVENVGNVRCHGVRRLDAGEIKIKSPKKKTKKTFHKHLSDALKYICLLGYCCCATHVASRTIVFLQYRGPVVRSSCALWVMFL